MHEIIYFDSCVFLAWLKDEENRANVVAELFEEARKKEIKIVTSALTIAEVLNIQGFKSPIPKENREGVRKLFNNEWIITKGINRGIAEKAQEIVWEYGIKPKDALHVATALTYSIKTLASYDDNLVKKGTIKTEFGNITFCEPKGSRQMNLLSMLSNDK